MSELTYRYLGPSDPPHGGCEIDGLHTHPATLPPEPVKTLWGGLTVDGIVYDVRIYTPDHGGFHTHHSRHEDGTSGRPDHHHHGPNCNRRQALLIPFVPAP